MIEFKDLSSQSTKKLKRALDIYKQFLQPNKAKDELNCSMKEVQKVEKELEYKEFESTIFDAIFKEIEKNLKDSLLRFFSSEEYQNYQKKQRSNKAKSVVKSTSIQDLVFSPELVAEFKTKKSFSIDEGVSRSNCWNWMLNKLKQGVYSTLNIKKSSEASNLSSFSSKRKQSFCKSGLSDLEEFEIIVEEVNCCKKGKSEDVKL